MFYLSAREAELKLSKETLSIPNVFVDGIHQAKDQLVNSQYNKKCDVVHIAMNLPEVKVSLHSAEIWIPNKHYSGVYGLLKLIFPDLLSQDKVLALDTDITVLADISLLWDEFDNFKNNNMLGLVENQSNWYIKKLSYGQSIWLAIGRGFNTGVMLTNLKKLREFNFNKIWTRITKQVLMEVHETVLADQDIMNSVIKKHSDIVVTLDCVWNVQLSDHTQSETCYKNSKQIKILHWNSPRKQEVQNKHAIDFNRMHKVFLEMDGNLLRRQLFQCSEIKVDNNNIAELNHEKDMSIKEKIIRTCSELKKKKRVDTSMQWVNNVDRSMESNYSPSLGDANEVNIKTKIIFSECGTFIINCFSKIYKFIINHIMLDRTFSALTSPSRTKFSYHHVVALVAQWENVRLRIRVCAGQGFESSHGDGGSSLIRYRVIVGIVSLKSYKLDEPMIFT
ncbi:hypothetical protein HCN44_007946, partial [Aphidius gifuensis]